MSSAAPLTNAKPLGNPAHLLPVRSSTHAYLILHSDSVPLQPSWTSIITAWLAEDTPSFDYGGFVVGEQNSEAFLFGKQDVSWSDYVSEEQGTYMRSAPGHLGWRSVLR